MKLGKLCKVISLAVIMVFFFTGCGANITADQKQTAPVWAPNLKPLSEPVTVTVGMKQVTSDAGILIGMARGYYEALGIKIEPVQFNTGQEMINQLAAGQLDVGATVSSAGLFNAMSRDIPIKIVADKGNNVADQGYYRLVVRKDLENTIKNYSDLKGKKIAIVGTASLDEISLDRVLAKGNMTLADVDVQVIRSFADILVSFGNQSIDAAMLIEPFVTQGMNKGLLSPWKDPVEYDPQAQTAILVFGKSLTQNKDVANRFMTAYIKSVRDYNDAFFKGINKAEMIDLLCKYSVVKDANLYKTMFPTGINPNGYVKANGVALDLDWYKKNDLLKQSIELDETLDNNFVNYALTQLGEYK